MAARVPVSLYRANLPYCSLCIRTLTGDDVAQLQSPFYRQLRGKKKVAKRPTTIKVKLLQDIPGYGRKGSITPVEPGRMRNTWYHRQQAEYITSSTLPGVKLQDVAAERDFTFGLESKEKELTKNEDAAKMEREKVELLPPVRATEILEAMIPSHLIFYRTPITPAESENPKPVKNQSRRAISSAAAELEAASEPLQKPLKPRPVAIFGSVSTSDIIGSIEAVLAGSKEGARIVLGAEDVTIMGNKGHEADGDQNTGIEGGRLKALGEFYVQARVKGGEAVQRTVSVKAADRQPDRQPDQ